MVSFFGKFWIVSSNMLLNINSICRLLHPRNTANSNSTLILQLYAEQILPREDLDRNAVSERNSKPQYFTSP